MLNYLIGVVGVLVIIALLIRIKKKNEHSFWVRDPVYRRPNFIYRLFKWIKLKLTFNRPYTISNIRKRLEKECLNEFYTRINKIILEDIVFSEKITTEININFTDVYHKTKLPNYLYDKYQDIILKVIPKIVTNYEKSGYLIDIAITNGRVCFNITKSL